MTWQEAETKCARFFESTKTPGSGIGNIKGDSRQVIKIGNSITNKPDGWRAECKSTVKNSIPFKYSWLLKVTEEAYEKDQIPGFYVVLGDNTLFALVPLYGPSRGLETIFSYTGLEPKIKQLSISTSLDKSILEYNTLRAPVYSNLWLKAKIYHRIEYWKIIPDDGIKTISMYDT